ncbi:hypothetical protein GCM10023205_74150 [Yinghuangia aomiensis]|uniref:Trypsin n=1 Tax=Yinghuangia aomiensis TaxID=676205 RepID=A0ABP9I861_9ACTN
MTIFAVSSLLAFVAAGAPVRAETNESLTVEQVAAMAPEEQAKVLNPLRVVAEAAIQVGRNVFPDIYTSTALGSGYRSVDVYITDLGRSAAFEQALEKFRPGLDMGILRFVQAKASEKAQAAAIQALYDQVGRPFSIYSAGIAADGGLQLSVDDAATAERYLSSAEARSRISGIEVGVQIDSGRPVKQTSRENDTTPFWGGAALGPSPSGSPGVSQCTSGIPAVSTWDGLEWLVTAAHCYPLFYSVSTMGGNPIGNVTYENQQFDAALIAAPTGKSVWDCCVPGVEYRPLNGPASKPLGDLVCQMGYNSRVVCGLWITNTYKTYPQNGTTVVGIGAVQLDFQTAARGGDSGGSVITVNDPDSRQINGIVSGIEWCSGSSNYCTLIYIDVMNIFNTFALSLH